MTPQSSRPEDAFRRDQKPTHRCVLCGAPAALFTEAGFASHYIAVHMRDSYPGPKPAGFVPLPRPDQEEAS